MRSPSLAALGLLLLSACSAIVTRHGGRRAEGDDAHDADGAIVLNGERTLVHWSDGDSFTFKSGPYSGQGTRLVGYNTLEAFGPVHRWGGWSREELFALAKGGAALCAAKEWECTTQGDPDSYNRVLVDCPKLALELARAGQALAYAVSGKPPPLVLDAMHQAQRAKRGMWAKGVPKSIITSLHSFGETANSTFKTSSNRLLDTRTGEAVLRKHSDTYQTCEEVCVDDSCMVYVPFDHRYKQQPPCLVGE
jgi:endonuclease YncB( thermonuclease family)